MGEANERLARIKQTIEGEKTALDDYILEQKDLIKRLNQEVTRLTIEANTIVIFSTACLTFFLEKTSGISIVKRACQR
jgi:hypothetical protein